MHRVVDGPIGAEVGKALEAKNMIVLACHDSGSRSFYNSKHPVRTPDDLKGMKIRIQSSDLNVAMIEALGANATPIPFGEVYTALQSGVVDGAENNWPSYESTRHFRVARYFTVDEHVIVPEIFVVAKTTWDGLSKADQDIVRQAAIESSQLQRQLWAERETQSAPAGRSRRRRDRRQYRQGAVEGGHAAGLRQIRRRSRDQASDGRDRRGEVTPADRSRQRRFAAERKTVAATEGECP